MKRLFIIESLGKVDKLKKICHEIFPNDKITVISTLGRLFDYPKTSPGYNLSSSKIIDQANVCNNKMSFLLNSIHNNDIIYLATDNDDEGETIANSIIELSTKPTIRIILNDLNLKSVSTAINNPTEIRKDIVSRTIAKRSFDKFINFTFSENYRSIGRVLSQGLSILDNVSESNSEIVIKTRDNGILAINIDKSDIKNIDNIMENLKCLNLNEIEWSEVENDPEFNLYNPLDFKDGINLISSNLNISCKEASDILQELYEQGRITYPRTDSKVLSEESMIITNSIAKSIGVDDFTLNKLEVINLINRNSEELSFFKQSGHYALSVTSLDDIESNIKIKEISNPYKKTLNLITENNIKSGQDLMYKKYEIKNPEIIFNVLKGYKYTLKSTKISLKSSKFERSVDFNEHINKGITKIIHPIENYIFNILAENNIGRPSTLIKHSLNLKKMLNSECKLNSNGIETLNIARKNIPTILNDDFTYNFNTVLNKGIEDKEIIILQLLDLIKVDINSNRSKGYGVENNKGIEFK